MTKREDDEGERRLSRRTDGGTAVAGRAKKSTDGIQDSAGAKTVPPPVEEQHVEAYPVNIDRVFEILKNQRRRAVLKYLQTDDDEVRLGTLAEEIAASECNKDVRAITSKERKRVYVALYQGHLPKMDDVGAIEYNKSRGKIKPGKNKEVFEQYLPAKTDNHSRWTKYHAIPPLVVGILALLFALGWLPV